MKNKTEDMAAYQREYQREYRKKNKEKNSEYMRNYMKNYYIENRDDILNKTKERQKTYIINDEKAQKIKEYQKEYQAQYRKKMKELKESRTNNSNAN
jgi:hypothetical protein